MKASAKTLERLERLAREYHEEEVEEGREIGFHVCGLCGFSQWSHSTAGTGFRVCAEVIPWGDCKRCVEIATRAPEVFQWVTGVLRFQREIPEGSRA